MCEKNTKCDIINTTQLHELMFLKHRWFHEEP